MEDEDSTELSLKLQCGDETVCFINPNPRPSSPLSGKALCRAETATAYPNETCRGTKDESEDIIRQGKPKKILRLSKHQSSLLEESFREHSTSLSPKHRSAIASKLNLQPRQVEVWFQNKRARTKSKRKEVECEILNQRCESLREENRKLERQVQALRTMKIVHGEEEDLYAQFPNSMSLATATLTMCPSCESLATKNSATTPFTSEPKTIHPLLNCQFPFRSPDC